MPPMLHNHGMYIGSLGNVTRWMAGQAEALGVEIYPGFAASDLTYREDGSVKGVIAGVMGIEKEWRARARTTLAGHGAQRQVCADRRGRAWLAGQAVDEASSSSRRIRQPQKFGIGMKELWQVPADQHQPGLRAAHLRMAAGQFERRRRHVPLSLRRSLCGRSASWCTSTTRNPWLSPFEEFQRFKHHPDVAEAPQGWRAHFLWRACDHRGRLAVDSEADLPGRRADWMLGRLREPAAHQGQPQRDEDRHDGRRGRVRGGDRRAARATS